MASMQSLLARLLSSGPRETRALQTDVSSFWLTQNLVSLFFLTLHFHVYMQQSGVLFLAVSTGHPFSAVFTEVSLCETSEAKSTFCLCCWDLTSGQVTRECSPAQNRQGTLKASDVSLLGLALLTVDGVDVHSVTVVTVVAKLLLLFLDLICSITVALVFCSLLLDVGS